MPSEVKDNLQEGAPDGFQRSVSAVFAGGASMCHTSRVDGEHLRPREIGRRVSREAAEVQYERELLFSTLVEMTSHVVCRIAKTTRMAYLAQCENITVTLTAVYKKLAGIELGTSQALVRSTARQERAKD